MISQKKKIDDESNINSFLKTLKNEQVLFQLDDGIFNFNLEKAVVNKDKSITFKSYKWFEIMITPEE